MANGCNFRINIESNIFRYLGILRLGFLKSLRVVRSSFLSVSDSIIETEENSERTYSPPVLGGVPEGGGGNNSSLLTPHSSLLTPHSQLLTPHSSLLTLLCFHLLCVHNQNSGRSFMSRSNLLIYASSNSCSLIVQGSSVITSILAE